MAFLRIMVFLAVLVALAAYVYRWWNPSRKQIQILVERLFQQREDEGSMRRLRTVGTRAQTELVAALDDPRVAVEFPDFEHALEASSPLERVVDLLEPLGAVEAAPALTRLVLHDDSGVRQHAARGLGALGENAAIEGLTLALQDADSGVREAATIGVEQAIDAERATQEFQAAVFPAMIGSLTNFESVYLDLPKLLLQIARDRAREELLRKDVLDPSKHSTQHVLAALNEEDEPIPHDLLLPLLREAESRLAEGPFAENYAEALVAYALNPDEHTREVLRSASGSQHEEVRVAAARALSALGGVRQAHEFAFDAFAANGFDALPRPLQLYLAVFLYDAEVRNGGHSQYFLNEGEWEVALEGLEAMGAMERASILRDARAIESEELPVDRFEVVDRRHYESQENVTELLARFTLQNHRHFRPAFDKPEG